MHESVHDVSPTSMTKAIEANSAEFLLALGRAGGAEERNDPDIHWVIGGSPIDYHNCVVRANLPPAAVDEVIRASIARFQAHGVPGSWHVGSGMRPADLGERLVMHGLVYAGDEVGMAMDLHSLPDKASVADALVVERVRDQRDLEVWTRTLAAGFGEGEREARWVGDMYGKIGLGDRTPWRHYLGRLDGEAVATASLFIGANVAGIYFVFTLPQVRRQGIGAALTLTALRDARDLGYRIGVLGASEAGYSVYRRLGFQEYCRIGIYEWRLPGS